MECCPNPTDFAFPMLADVYYPFVEQSAYGNVAKTWTLDRTVACNLEPAGSETKEAVSPNIAVTMSLILSGRVRSDLRITDLGGMKSVTNVIVTNVRDKLSNQIYIETSGPRMGKPTLFEIATHEPAIGPFGKADFYKVVLRRSDNQEVDV